MAAVYTESMKAHAVTLLERAHAWTRATRKRDGLAFVIFESSRRDRDGNVIGYYTTADACTCPGWNFRQACSHQLAVRTDQDGLGTRRRRTYADLFPSCRVAGCNDQPALGERDCESHVLRDAF